MCTNGSSTKTSSFFKLTRHFFFFFFLAYSSFIFYIFVFRRSTSKQQKSSLKSFIAVVIATHQNIALLSNFEWSLICSNFTSKLRCKRPVLCLQITNDNLVKTQFQTRSLCSFSPPVCHKHTNCSHFFKLKANKGTHEKLVRQQIDQLQDVASYQGSDGFLYFKCIYVCFQATMNELHLLFFFGRDERWESFQAAVAIIKTSWLILGLEIRAEQVWPALVTVS